MSKPQGADIEQYKKNLSQVAQTMYTQSLALNEKVRTLSILQAIDAITLESNRGLKQLSTDITKTITNQSKFSLISLYTLEEIDGHSIHFQGWSLSKEYEQKGLSDTMLGLLTAARIDIASTWVSTPHRNQIVPLDRPERLMHMGLAPEHLEYVYNSLSQSLDMRCLYVTKLTVSDATVGLLFVGLQELSPHIDDIELIERIAKTTGIAIYNRLLYEQNLRSIEQLRLSNEKLRAIDTAKDEFIAMASHQLRTPLTSMKGYLSMVLDGDYGRISDDQRSVLKKSMASSQRMVYLVADLLNVSRLKNGKFVISNAPTDLAGLVREEVVQLQETAEAKDILLETKIPKKASELMLDATKIRQVVMNFVDNAIYYTPSGGTVTVSVTEDEQSVTFTVKDTGLGVPKDEQTKLFSKFFRASNARKARPDGTGLGLYMAARVIAAQGGKVLFSSKEGVGSIFGFRMPKTPTTKDPK